MTSTRKTSATPRTNAPSRRRRKTASRQIADLRPEGVEQVTGGTETILGGGKTVHIDFCKTDH